MAAKKNKLSTFIFIFIVLLLVVLAALLLLPVHGKYRKMEARLERLERELAEKNAECIRLSRIVHDLQHEPKAVEKVAREKFGLCKEGEVIYKYGDSERTTGSKKSSQKH